MVWSVQAPPHHAKSIHSFFSSTIMKVWSLVVTILYSSLRADAAVLDDRYGSAVATEQLQSSRDTTLGEHSLEDCTFQAYVHFTSRPHQRFTQLTNMPTASPATGATAMRVHSRPYPATLPVSWLLIATPTESGRAVQGCGTTTTYVHSRNFTD